MTIARSQLLLKVSDLVGRPGASRRVDLDLPVPPGLDLPLAEVGEPVALHGVVESVVDGLLVRGRVEARMRLACARCLTDIEQAVGLDVVELFADPTRATEDAEVEEGYEIRDGHLDLDTLLRDVLATAVPLQPLCRPDCQGLCAVCGADRNVTDCDCRENEDDPRWAALADLQLPDERG